MKIIFHHLKGFHSSEQIFWKVRVTLTLQKKYKTVQNISQQFSSNYTSSSDDKDNINNFPNKAFSLHCSRK